MADERSWVTRDADVVWHGFTQMAVYPDNAPVIVERAEGRELIDTEGRRYLDAISSLWVTTLGHRVPELDQALRDQLDRVAHTTMLGNGNRIVIELAEALAPRVPVDDPHFLFAADGSSAVEQALRIAFQYWTNRGVTGRTSYLAFSDGYHGDTIGSLSVGAGGFGTDVYEPLRFPVRRAPAFAEVDGLRRAAAMVRQHRDELAAVIVEPLAQGAAGVRTAPAKDFAVVGQACRDADVLLICDEVATGFGRTGTLFASEQCGLRPDLLTMGKGITGGYLPMAATAVTRRVYDAFLGPDFSERTLYHGHSYGGNALAAAVALRHLSLLDEWDVLANVRARSAQLRQALEEKVAAHPAVVDVRVVGLMSAIELRDQAGSAGRPERPGAGGPAGGAGGAALARRVGVAMVRGGVLARSLGDNVLLVPPLTTTAAEIDRIVSALASALAETAAS